VRNQCDFCILPFVFVEHGLSLQVNLCVSVALEVLTLRKELIAESIFLVEQVLRERLGGHNGHDLDVHAVPFDLAGQTRDDFGHGVCVGAPD